MRRIFSVILRPNTSASASGVLPPDFAELLARLIEAAEAALSVPSGLPA